ncbi:sigma-54 interaction domain-containing protein [Pseudobdellovibrio exovorus]|uniref:Nitrogen assimilation regulatory protein n=1 Tax=Pseudobdellovibrio exovorus JSS TaxID=1184267 RepID=M4VP79_9BACT|nr:sigma 54-interacting transcriptional regulator [Pseudobdellovibrio exovorus]AGH94939.1 nitrogen assimilation regulatory protein [Pseudobdellovibrio exovorus JSS]
MQYKIELANDKGQSWSLQKLTYIGQDPNCQIHLQGEGVSERHARLELQDTQLILKDLRSTTGTFVNGVRVLEAVLKIGDCLRIGSLELCLKDNRAIQSKFSLSSRSHSWNEQLQCLSSVSNTSFPVLLLGPSGTGKDIIAQALHHNSPRANASFVSVNCSALSETLVESELFGHIKGSFTGAIADRKGAFESARGGTLFLDEIGDLPYGLQAKLLRALENSEIRPVGSDRTIKTNVRIIAATHQHLYQKIQEGSFRSDLFYRLNVITVEVPALKDRKEDFEDLIYQFARQMRVRFSHNTIQLLKKYEWPGNIRELKNVVSRASALFPQTLIEERHLSVLLSRKEQSIYGSTEAQLAVTNTLPVIKEIEKQMIMKRLMANHGNQKRTAHDLGMPKSTLHDRIKSYNLDLKEFKT